MASYAQIVRALTPPAFWNFGKRRLPGVVRALGGHYTHIRFTGDYPSFAAARQASQGYAEPNILEKTRTALLKVKRGENRWEQDGMVSDSAELPWPLLACLTRVAAVQGNRELRVVDFGGSLGSTYFWCRDFFKEDFRLRWHVVEQAGHVKVGRADFQDDELRFDFSVEDVLAQLQPDVLLMSGVLHYLEEPAAFLKKLPGWGIPYFILDRTPLWRHPYDRLTVQHVPEEIYRASYPAWFLSEEKIISQLTRDYTLRWRAPDKETWEVADEAVPNCLYFFQRKSHLST